MYTSPNCLYSRNPLTCSYLCLNACLESSTHTEFYKYSLNCCIFFITNFSKPNDLISIIVIIIIIITLVIFWILVVTTFATSLILSLAFVHSAKEMHVILLHYVLRWPMELFDITPLGRVLNRFSKDVDVVDNVLPQVIKSWIFMLFSVIIHNWQYSFTHTFYQPQNCTRLIYYRIRRQFLFYPWYHIDI